ncbi:MAG: M64 family metallopeptidase [Polyangiaceae bacterium]
MLRAHFGKLVALVSLTAVVPLACGGGDASPKNPGGGGGGAGGTTSTPKAPARVVASLMLTADKVQLVGLHEVSPTTIPVKQSLEPMLEWRFESDTGKVLASGKISNPQVAKSEFGPDGKANPKQVSAKVTVFDIELPNTGGWFTIVPSPSSGQSKPLGPADQNPFSIFIQMLFGGGQSGTGGEPNADAGVGAAGGAGGAGGAAAGAGGTPAGGTSAGGAPAGGAGGAPVGGAGGAEAGPSEQVVKPTEACTAYTFLVVAEGYTKAEESKFQTDAKSMIDVLETIPGFKENWKYISVYRKFFVSNDSGLSDAQVPIVKDTAFRVEHPYNPADPDYRRAIWMRPDVPAETLAKLEGARSETKADVVLMIANTAEWAGAAMASQRLGIFSAHPSVGRVAGHEIGHALWDLEDEYDYGTCDPNSYEPLGPNVALGSPYPWEAMMTKGVQLPTTGEDPSTVGAYKGALYCPDNVYRPQFTCFMKDAMVDFCKVCLAHVTKQFKERTAACQPKGSCNHSECTPGGALTQDCSTCSSAICSLRPDCCDPAKGWTEECVTEAQNTVGICRGVCADGKGQCAHSECTDGAALTDGCSTCATAVCKRDPYCCSSTGKWDWICAAEAEKDPYCKCPAQ